jgi:hypothetical protein
MSRVLLDYPHRSAGHCGSGALRDLLDWAGLGWDGPPDEGLVFGLGGALSFSYLRLPGLTPPIYLVGRGADLELDLPRRLGAHVELTQTDDPVQGWQWVRDELDAGRPVLVWADIAELPYLRVRLKMSRHDIVIIGYDDDAQVAFVVDNDREHVQEVPYDALARARASTAFPTPARHATFTITWPARLPELRAVAAEAFASSAALMRAGGSELADATSLPSTAVAGSGLSGVAVFAEDLARWPQVFSREEHDASLRALPAFIEKAGTGGGLFRRLQAQGCADVAARTGLDVVAQAADAVARCAAAWSALATAATGQQALEVRGQHCAQAALRLPALEAAAVDALESAVVALRTRS